MSRLFTESFEAQHLLRFSAVTGTIFTTSLIDGVACIGMSGNEMCEATIAAQSEFYVGFWFRATNSASTIQLLQWRSGATELGRLQMNSVTKVMEVVINSVTVASSTVTLNDTTNYHIEVHVLIDNTVGVVQVKKDAVQIINYSNQDTQPGADTTVTVVRWGGINGVAFYDTLVINSTAGTESNSWTGVVRRKLLTPTGPGNYVDNWSRNTGASNWQAVDEVPHTSDTDYLFTTTSSLYESFSMLDHGLTNATILAVATAVIAKKDSGTSKLIVGIRDNDNSTDYMTPAQNLSVSYGVIEERRTLDPSTGAAWTLAGANTTEALIVSSE